MNNFDPHHIKLSNRATKGIIVGYSLNHNGYKCFIPITEKGTEIDITSSNPIDVHKICRDILEMRSKNPTIIAVFKSQIRILSFFLFLFYSLLVPSEPFNKLQKF